MCYDPWVKRTGSDVPDMENHPDYYQTESCYVECPLWGPWSPCTARPGGVGIQIRFDQSDPSIQDVKQCTNDVPVGPKESEVHYGPCNTACGVGKRQKGMFNDFYFIGIDVRLLTESSDLENFHQRLTGTFQTGLPDGEIIFENPLERPERAESPRRIPDFSTGTDQFLGFP